MSFFDHSMYPKFRMATNKITNKMNHLDSSNQVLGLTAWGQPSPKTLYRDQVNRLKKANL